jgi:hypothetical protein
LPVPKSTDLTLKRLKEKFSEKILKPKSPSTYNLNTNGISHISSDKVIQNDEMWRVGIICKKDCYYITTEILKCLERNGYEWKIISSSYKIKCRKKKIEQKENNGNNRNSNLNVLIQIFCVKKYLCI